MIMVADLIKRLQRLCQVIMYMLDWDSQLVLKLCAGMQTIYVLIELHTRRQTSPAWTPSQNTTWDRQAFQWNLSWNSRRQIDYKSFPGILMANTRRQQEASDTKTDTVLPRLALVHRINMSHEFVAQSFIRKIRVIFSTYIICETLR